MFKRILAIKLRSLGDTVILTASLNALKAAFPSARIDVAVTAPWAPLLENHPAVHHIWPYERREEKAARAKNIARLAIKLRKPKYDCVLNFHASPSSAVLAFATGAKTRAIHFHGHKDANRYSTVEILGKGTVKAAIERDMDAIRALGLTIAVGEMPKIYLRDSEIEYAQSLLQKRNLKKPILALGLGASRPTKIWPLERYADLAERWAEKTGGSVITCSTSAERLLIHRFLKSVQKTSVEVFSDLGIRDLTAVLSQVQVYAGNDSGPKHLAVAVGTPTVTMIGPENPVEWHPYDLAKNPYLYIENLSCRKDALPGLPPWCGLDVCTSEHHRCMIGIGVESALKECLRVAGA